MGLNLVSLMHAKLSHISDEFASGFRQVIIVHHEKQFLGQFNCTFKKKIVFHFIFFTLPSFSGFLLGKVHLHSHLPQSSHFALAQLATFLQHKILGARILALNNLGESPHYTASSFQLFEILLHLQAYVEAKAGSKCAYNYITISWILTARGLK